MNSTIRVSGHYGVGLRLGWVPRLVEPSEVRFVIGDPFLDGLPRWLDGLHCLDVEGWRRRAGERGLIKQRDRSLMISAHLIHADFQLSIVIENREFVDPSFGS